MQKKCNCVNVITNKKQGMKHSKLSFLNTKILLGLLLVSNLILITYFLLLGYYGGLSSDDYVFFSIIRENGAWYLIKDMYLHWSPRYGVFIINSFYIKLFGLFDNFLPITILNLLFRSILFIKIFF